MDRTPAEGAASRGGDRREQDRRRLDRRSPTPLWKRPWAYVAYGILGALVVFFSLTRIGGEREEPVEVVASNAPPALDTVSRPAAEAPLQEAYSQGDFERLLAEGEGAVGQRVRTVVFCEQINPIALRVGPERPVHPSVAALADVNNRVPGAECQWGSGANAPELVLIVPPGLAELFAAAPVVEQGFVRRRRVRAEVEWIGRSEPLALRNVAVLRAIL